MTDGQSAVQYSGSVEFAIFFNVSVFQELLVINVSFVLHDILDVNEVQGAFVTKISTQREWFDNRLTYINHP